jgi:site-specific DNA recombinase
LKPEDEWITVKDHHPAIIEIEQWDKCAEIRAYNHRRSNAPKRYKRKNTHIFAGLIICGKCGSTYQATIDRARTGGYRPSIYLCSRRKQYSDCQNKYMSDITLGPFILNYISNIIKANANMGKTTTPDMFKKKLLRGDVFKDVKDIAPSGLNEMYNMIVSKKFNSDPFTSTVHRDESQPDFASERELLISEKRKYLRALDRLKTLYLYNDNAMAEKDYIIENKNILDNLKRVDERLEEIEKNSSQNFTITDSEFIEKASYFIISQELSNQRYINFNSLIQHIDTNVLKNFIQSVIKKIVVLDGRITSIQFKNGIEHDFLY